MLKNPKIWLVAILSFALVASSGIGYAWMTAANVTEEELGLRQESLYEEKGMYPAHGDPIQREAGESERFERSFENSPPLIPHDITGMLPLAETDNICLDCHNPQDAVSQGSTPIPKSHYVELGTGKDLKGELDGDRFNCMQCHVIQTTVTPPIVNLFKGEFRDEKGRYRSNLIDNLNEGVRAD
jgi:cytochrome c-type protein NapB